MTSYVVIVGLSPVFSSVTLPPPPAPPAPPVPTREDHQESYRVLCLVNYHEARLAGCDHSSAILEVSRILRKAEHPWSSRHVVEKEINQALGRRPGAARKVKS